MQENQATNTDNVQYDLISCLYHSLQSAQTCEAYAKDAQQSGNQNLTQFFRDVQQDCNKQAQRARELLDQMRPSR
ncbi:hypothetical protein [Ktedonobacter racemifer]|uniref:Uncharacterized protein n=1 Tax=Ktedonobacter racemifer DSM 44963 TaxID=485913 RepID=D6U479_KTERA|nr:hypothetical protein [Ktedonobacter racemifer]EFH81309.1 conserved hypothetical protein [Ktedonobacter racemifer DSM 44963]